MLGPKAVPKTKRDIAKTTASLALIPLIDARNVTIFLRLYRDKSQMELEPLCVKFKFMYIHRFVLRLELLEILSNTHSES